VVVESIIYVIVCFQIAADIVQSGDRNMFSNEESTILPKTSLCHDDNYVCLYGNSEFYI